MSRLVINTLTIHELETRVKLSIVSFLVLCQRVVLWVLAGALFRFSHQRKEPNRILVLRTGGLGDFLFAVPSMVALRRRFPTAKIVLLTAASSQKVGLSKVASYTDLSRSYPWLPFVSPSIVDEAIVFQSTDWQYLQTYIRPKIGALSADLTFILSHPGETFTSLVKKFLFLKIVGAKGSIYGWRKSSTYGILRKSQDEAHRFGHKVTGPLKALMESPLLSSIHEKDVAFNLHIDDEARRWAAELWTFRSWADKTVIVLAPGSINQHKAWPLQSYVGLGRHFLEISDVSVVVVGPPNDRPLGEHLQNELGAKCVNLVGEIDLMHTAALMERSAILVGNDGGAVHLASAVGCRCVTVANGIELPGAVEPWFDKAGSVRHSVSCSPCYSELFCPLGHQECVTGITVDQVLDRCRSLLLNIYASA